MSSSLPVLSDNFVPRSVDDFEQSHNPENCELITMNKTSDNLGHIWYVVSFLFQGFEIFNTQDIEYSSRMELDDRDRRSLDLPDTCGIPRNVRLYQLHGKDEEEQK